MFLSRRLVSKSPVEQITAPTVAAPTELVQDCPTQTQEETRDEPNPLATRMVTLPSISPLIEYLGCEHAEHRFGIVRFS
jgi:hypothetical protein